MKYIKSFNEKYLSIYGEEWKKYLPDSLTLLKEEAGLEKQYTFRKGNVMTHSDLLQITYEQDVWGAPDTLEIDIYFLNWKCEHCKEDSLKLNIDITLGDYMISEFSISKPTGVEVIQYTSYGSKLDPSDTLLAFDDESLKNLVMFLNKFNHGLILKLSDFDFLSK